jgi:hypothetical protein
MAQMNEQQALRAVAALTKERPQWVPVLAAALTVAERAQPYGGEFAGAWVLDELEQRTGKRTWLPNLRVLLSYGFLEKVGESTRGGRRAYYRCVNAQAIGRALTRLAPVGGHGQRPPDRPPRKFQFVGAGNSGEPGTDVARRAGEITYLPRSWR